MARGFGASLMQLRGDNVDRPVDAGSFLEKRSYRRRRMTDGLRILPVFGLWLFMVPLLWPGTVVPLADAGVPMSTALIYIFLVWTVLIVLCGLLSSVQKRDGASLSDTAPELPDVR